MTTLSLPARVGLPRTLLASALVLAMTACATAPVPRLERAASGPAPSTGPNAATAADAGVAAEPLAADDGDAKPQIRRGSGQVINRAAATAPPPALRGATSGSVKFNFEGEALHAVVKAILGDMLGYNYVIAPGVQGTVTYNTARDVTPAEALSVLEMILAWNNARMVWGDGRYSIVPSDQAIAGTVGPRTGSPANARGFESRVVPLKYISATEMEKLLKPYARPNAIVNVDNGRNVITVAGSRAELENYLRTIEVFDVDWLAGMSVGVFPIESGRASKVVQDLEKVFGEQSKSPVAGMFRFMPLEGANAVLVITPQADYLDDIQQWLERIESAGGAQQLYTHELRYIQARELADRLSEVFGGGGRGGSEGGGAPSLMPGLDSVELRDGENGSIAQLGNDSGAVGTPGGTGGGLGQGSLSLNQRREGSGSVTLEVDGDRVGVSAVEETNSILVRATPSAWKSIRDVVERLDVMPMQVHIEAQVVQVNLSGELSYGVNWFFERAVTDAGLPSAVGRDTWSAIAGSIQPSSGVEGVPNGLSWTFLGRNAAAIISALDSVSDVQVLQSPSVLVRNNSEATFNVGSRIPIASVTVNPGIDSGNTFSQVQYLDTGTILKVRPRATRDGTVFMDIVQEVSQPGSEPDQNGNVRIDTRRLKTEAAVNAGDTVLLAGLINDEARRGSSGFPGLSRIPVVGALFGRQTTYSGRTETIVMITPRIVRNPNEARELTDEYGRRFRALEPLNRSKTPRQP